MRELDLTEEPKKKKSAKKDEEEPISVPFLVYLKGFFLLTVILFGMFILSSVAEKQKSAKVTSHKFSFSPKDLTKNIDKDAILEVAQKEATTNVFYNKAVSGIESGRDKVLGEASHAATVATEKAKKTIFDYLYEHTLGVVMQDLIQKMPEEQKKKLIEKVSE